MNDLARRTDHKRSIDSEEGVGHAMAAQHKQEQLLIVSGHARAFVHARIMPLTRAPCHVNVPSAHVCIDTHSRTHIHTQMCRLSCACSTS